MSDPEVICLSSDDDNNEPDPYKNSHATPTETPEIVRLLLENNKRKNSTETKVKVFDPLNEDVPEIISESFTHNGKFPGPCTIIHDMQLNHKIVGTTVVDLFIGVIKPILKERDVFVIQKLRRHASLAGPESLASAEFNSSTQMLIKEVGKDPSNVFVYAKKLMDSLKAMRNTKTQPSSSKPGPVELNKEEAELLQESSRSSVCTERRIAKLERFLQRLDKKIKEVSQQEVDWDDDSESAYILEERLKNRFVKVMDKICELKNAVLDTARPVEKKFNFEGTRYPEINRAISRLLRQGRDMPDYEDIVSVIKTTNETYNINLSECNIEDLAPRIFEHVGGELQKRRKRDLFFTLEAYGDEELAKEDPAYANPEMLAKLGENRALFKRNLNEVLDKYARKQTELKEEATEVPEGEPRAESEEEDESESETGEDIGDIEEDISVGSSSPVASRPGTPNGLNGNVLKVTDRQLKRRYSLTDLGEPNRKLPRQAISD